MPLCLKVPKKYLLKATQFRAGDIENSATSLKSFVCAAVTHTAITTTNKSPQNMSVLQMIELSVSHTERNPNSIKYHLHETRWTLVIIARTHSTSFLVYTFYDLRCAGVFNKRRATKCVNIYFIGCVGLRRIGVYNLSQIIIYHRKV